MYLQTHCSSCDKKIIQDETHNEIEKLYWLEGEGGIYETQWFKTLLSLKSFSKIIAPQLSAKYSVQKDKINALLPKLKALDKELCQPVREKIEEHIRQFFKKKDKLIPIPEFENEEGTKTPYASSPLCKNCHSELDLYKSAYPDEIEAKSIANKLESDEVRKELEQISSEIDEKDFGSGEEMIKKQKKLTKEAILEKVKELNDKTVRERERERERESKNGNKPTNWTPLWIGLAVVGIILLLIIILYFAFRKKKSKKISKSGN